MIKKNPGVESAQAVCEKHKNVSMVVPKFKESKGTDFNDLFIAEGKDEVKKQILGESKHEKESSDPLAWISKFKPSKEDIAMFADPEFIIEDLVIRGHLIGIVAPPNGGKTTIFFYLAGVMAKKGYNVIYVNADISASDVKRMAPMAEENGFELLLPDMVVGLSMNDVVSHLEELNDSGFDLKDYVFIFDTMKKMVDVIDKRKSKLILALLRSLTSKGATMITLGHVNKHKGNDGKHIFEGTGDFRADVDELIYLIPDDKKSDGSMNVSSVPDKIRGDIKPITFEIDSERNVKLLDDYVDVKKEHEESNQRKKDCECIKAIEECLLQHGEVKQCDVTKYCKDEYGFTKAPVIKILKRYTSDIWMVKDGQTNNAKLYSLLRPLAYKKLEKSAPSEKPKTGETET